VNIRFVVRQLGTLFMVLSGVLLAVAGWAALQAAVGAAGEAAALNALLLAALIGLVIGGGCRYLTRGSSTALGRREALLLVASSWLLGAALAALPYLIWSRLDGGGGSGHAFQSPVNCYFESMSGLTTTGATILADISSLPRSILLWRALTHWLGGLGIVVLFVAVLPTLGVGGKRLFRVEAPGPEPEGVHPHIRETARILWLIYLGLTVAEIVALRICGLSWFQALCHTFATLATGGFSTGDASIGQFGSTAVHVVIISFMILAGVDFGLYFQLLRGRLGAVWRDAELRSYLSIMAVAAIVVIITIWSRPISMTTGELRGPSPGVAIREGLFTVVSLQTTTGFCTANFDTWPFLAKAVLLLLMFVGGSGGSTAGGIKVVRIVIAFKVLIAEIERVFRPNVVRPLRIAQTTVSHEMQLATVAYVLGIMILFGLGTGALMLVEPAVNINMTTAATASLATLCNIGPGLDLVGAVAHYAWFTDSSKLVLVLLMALGRLEVFAVLVLFVPRFWRTD